MLNNIYRNEIARLDLLILNWNMLAESDVTKHKLGKYDIDTTLGLCNNAFLFNLPQNVLKHCFMTSPNFSGHVLYPLGRDDWYNNKNKFTVERLRLAKHIRTELFFMGAPQPTLSEKISKLYENNLVCFLTIFVIFLIIGAMFFSKV